MLDCQTDFIIYNNDILYHIMLRCDNPAIYRVNKTTNEIIGVWKSLKPLRLKGVK